MVLTPNPRFPLMLMIAATLGCGGGDSTTPAIDARFAVDARRPADAPTIDPDAPGGGDPVQASRKLETTGPIAVALDPSGVPALAGALDLPTDLGGGVQLTPNQDVGSKAKDAFVAKLNAGGSGVWGHRYGDKNEQYSNAIAVNANGVVLVAGTFVGTLEYAPGKSLTTTAPDPGIGFVMAIDGTSGDALWAKIVDLGLGGIAVRAAVDPTDSGFVLAGYATGPAMFDSFVGTSGGGQDIFAAKVKGDSTGDLVWAHQIGGTGDQLANGVAVAANGSVFVAGGYRGVLDFGNGALPTPPTGAQYMFLAKLDGTGTAADAVAIPQTGSARARANSVVIDSGGHVIIGGEGNGTLAFDAGTSLTLAPSGVDGFVARLDPDLRHATWARRIGDTVLTQLGTQPVTGVAVDGAGDVVAVGNFKGTVDFGMGAPISPPTGQSDAFALKMAAATGATRWVRTTNGSGIEAATSVAIDASDNTVWVVGTFVSDTTPPIANWGTSLATELIFTLDTANPHTYLVKLAP